MSMESGIEEINDVISSGFYGRAIEQGMERAIAILRRHAEPVGDAVVAEREADYGSSAIVQDDGTVKLQGAAVVQADDGKDAKITRLRSEYQRLFDAVSKSQLEIANNSRWVEEVAKAADKASVDVKAALLAKLEALVEEGPEAPHASADVPAAIPVK